MKDGDVAALAGIRRLTLWNVRFPRDFRFSDLEDLELLDLRGGTRADLADLEGCLTLQGLVVNQVRGLADITTLSGLTSLRILSLYGLAKVTHLPDLSRLARLQRLDLGQMRSLTGWEALLTPPRLRELFFRNLLHPDPDVMDALASHPRLQSFDWMAPDVAARVQDPIRQRFAAMPRARSVRPEVWLDDALRGMDDPTD
jgi:hypothetical protein